jgi:hypothetical protein
MESIERFEQADFVGLPAGLTKIVSAVKSIPPPKEAGKAIVAAVKKEAPGIVKAVVAAAPAAATNIVKAAEKKVESAVSSIAKAAESLNPADIIKGAIQEMKDGLKDAYNDGVSAAKEAFVSVFQAVREHVKSMLVVIKDFAVQHFNELVEASKKAFSKAHDLAIEAFDKVKETAHSSLEKLGDLAKKELNVVQDLIKSQFPELDFSKGPGAVMAMGAMSMVGKVVDTADYLAGYVLQNNAVKPIVHTYAPAMIAVSGISAMVVVSTFKPLMLLGDMVAGLIGWLIMLTFMYIAMATWVSSAGPTDDIAKTVGAWGVFQIDLFTQKPVAPKGTVFALAGM